MMNPEDRDRLIKEISSSNLETQASNFEIILNTAKKIHFTRGEYKDSYPSARLQTNNLLLQKIIISGYSLRKLIYGIDIPDNSNANIKIYDPITLNIVLRSILETYLTFYHLNFAENNDENELRYLIWEYYGLKYRSKLKIRAEDISSKHREVKDRDNKEIAKLESEIIKSNLYQSLSDEKKDTFLKEIRKNWKISFKGNSYLKLGFQEILNGIGLRITFYENQYNYLSWSAHTTSILIYQLRDMYTNGFDKFEVKNFLVKACSIIAMAVRDLITIDPDYLPSYHQQSQRDKDYLNIYNYFFRGNTYTINKID